MKGRWTNSSCWLNWRSIVEKANAIGSVLHIMPKLNSCLMLNDEHDERSIPTASERKESIVMISVIMKYAIENGSAPGAMATSKAFIIL